jgi:hypothetical protein
MPANSPKEPITMFSRRLLLAGLGTLALAAAPVPLAVAKTSTSHALLFQNQAHTMDCGEKAPLPHHQASLVLCSAAGIPRPTGGGVGDPFVQIARQGKPKLVLVSQNDFETSKIATLKPGATWSNLGVACKVLGRTVTCKNASKHGFTIGNGKYKPF